MSHEWNCRCPKCRAQILQDTLDPLHEEPWKQDQADIDRERDDTLYGQRWEPGDEAL